MVIGFKTQFVLPIIAGTKIHTIREDAKHRWRQGMTMHMATGVRTKNYNCFKTTTCTGTRAINIDPVSRKIYIICNGYEFHYFTDEGKETLALNDGFDSIEDFWKWFDKPFHGKIIYWTSRKY